MNAMQWEVLRASDEVLIDHIEVDTWQVREVTDQSIVKEYADAIAEGYLFPPVILFTEDDSTYFVGDGIHRIKAAILAQRLCVAATVYRGGLDEAKLYAAGANKGLRMTNADKRRAVESVLDNHLSNNMSLREIANWCGVSYVTVKNVKSDREREHGLLNFNTSQSGDSAEYEDTTDLQQEIRERVSGTEVDNSDDYDEGDYEPQERPTIVDHAATAVETEDAVAVAEVKPTLAYEQEIEHACSILAGTPIVQWWPIYRDKASDMAVASLRVAIEDEE